VSARFEIRRILVATDFGPVAHRALEVALDLAVVHGASVLLVHGFEVPDFGPEGSRGYAAQMRERASERLEALAREVSHRAEGVTVRTEARQGTAWEQIASAAQASGADLVVVGTHGRRGVQRALLGSVAEKVVRTCPVPVLTVHADETDG
jgi:nucleotide-binding universal stress UspA family protein